MMRSPNNMTTFAVLLGFCAQTALCAQQPYSTNSYLRGSPSYDEMVYDENMRLVRVVRRRLPETDKESGGGELERIPDPPTTQQDLKPQAKPIPTNDQLPQEENPIKDPASCDANDLVAKAQTSECGQDYRPGDRVEVYYAKSKTWYPATYDGKSTNFRFDHDIIYDDTPLKPIAKRDEDVRRLPRESDGRSDYEIFMIKTKYEIKRIEQSYQDEIRALERDIKESEAAVERFWEEGTSDAVDQRRKDRIKRKKDSLRSLQEGLKNNVQIQKLRKAMITRAV